MADVTWQPGSLNILIGPNASGKSNLLRCVEMLSASARGELEKYVQREGGMEPLVWDGSASVIEFLVELARQDHVAIGNQYSLALKRLGKRSTYQIGYEYLADFGASSSKWIELHPVMRCFMKGNGRSS